MPEELAVENPPSLQESVGQIKADLAAFWQTVGPFCRAVDELCKAPIGKDPGSEISYIGFSPTLPQTIVDLYDELDEALDELYDDLDTALGISDDDDGLDATNKIVEAIKKVYPDLDDETLAKAIRSVGGEEEEQESESPYAEPEPGAVQPEAGDEV
jgi:hypothetical protein